MADKGETLKAKKEEEADPNSAPLTPDSEKPQTATDANMQAGANQSVEAARGTMFGDTTSSHGDANVSGLHGRDGGVIGAPEGGGPNNPVAEDHVIDPSFEQAPTDE